MALLDDRQKQRAVEVMTEYLHAPSGLPGWDDEKTPVEEDLELDSNRRAVIQLQLQPLLSSFLNGQVEIQDFKSKVDSINKRNELWGFKGIKGQMFFNMVVNVASDALEECTEEMISALSLPENDALASSRIKTFASYVKRIGDDWVTAGNSKYSAPKVGSIPFFLSYFWQIQDPQIWPVYFTASVQALADLNLWQPSDDIASSYISFKDINNELAALFSESCHETFDLYRVSHVLWYKVHAAMSDGQLPQPVTGNIATTQVLPAAVLDRLPDSYLPPIVSILPAMSRNEPVLIEAANRSGISLEKAFEKHVHAAFSLLGFQTTLLGQGNGRVPDGIALAEDFNYAILWDGKIRADGYRMGTDDRAIRDYVTTQSREMKRKRLFKNIYFVIVSSTFADDYDDQIRSIKMETDVNEVILLEIDALVAMVDAKLRAPLQITIGPDGLQRLFSSSGVLRTNSVQEMLV